MSYVYAWYPKQEGEPTEAVAVIEAAWRECRELQTTSLEETTERIVNSITENEREEFVCYLGDTVVAFGCLVLDDDDHVGECVGVQWSYATPEARSQSGFARRLFRGLREAARHLGLPYAYTKRIGEGKYIIQYKETPHG